MKTFSKRFLSFLLIVITVFSISALSFVTYYAASDSVAATDSVRLRKTPEILSGNVIDSIAKNEEVTLLKDSTDGWAYVMKANGVKGYCSVDYLSVPSGSKVTLKGVANSDVNLRKGPSTDYSVVKLVSKGTAFTVTDNSQELWVKVQVQNSEGYIYRQYADLNVALSKVNNDDKPVVNPPVNKPDTPDWFDSSALDSLVSQNGASNREESFVDMYLCEKSISVERNDTYTLTAVTSVAGLVSSVRYKSSDSSVATVSSNGTVKGVSVGSAVITAYLENGVSAQCKVEIIPSTRPDPLELSKTEIKISKGNSYQLTANMPVKWKTSDDSIATVKDGVVTAKAKGEAVITAYTDSQSVECKVTVTAAASTITLYKNAVSVYAGKTYYNGATSSTNVTWSSSDTSVAKVSNGFITGVSKGSAVITAKNSSDEITCIVTVKDAEPVRFAYCKPNTAGVGEQITLYALTDTTRTAVKFEFTVGSKKVTVNATNKVKDGNAYLWSGTTTVSSAGTYNVVTYSKSNGEWKTCSGSDDAKTTIFVRNTNNLSTETMEERRCTDELISLIAAFEGYSSSVYFDKLANSIPTIGYGKVIYLGDSFYNDMTKNEAYAYLVRTVNNGGFTSSMNSYLNKHNIYRNQYQFDALVSFSYNLGPNMISNDSDFKKIFTASVPQEGVSDKDAYINASGVNMRSGPSTSSEIIKTLNYGSILTLIETKPSDNWYHVKTQDGKEGYVYADYVSKGQLTTTSEHYLSKVNKEDFTEQLLQYHHAGPSCVWGLLYRRVDELELFFKGDYVRDGSSNKYNFDYKCSVNSSTYL